MSILRIVLASVLCTCAAVAQQGAVSSGISPVPTVAAGTSIPDNSQQFVFLGPNIANLTISYPASLAPGAAAGGRITLTVKTLNRVKPVVSTTVAVNSNGTYDYSFTLQNDPSAPDPVAVWSVAMPAVDAALTATHTSWLATQEPVPGNPNPPTGTVSMFPVALTTWRGPGGASIAAGQVAAGFHITSAYLPGLTMVYARSAEDYAVPPDLPAPVNTQLQRMRQRDWMNKRVVAIGPRFPKAWSKDVIAADFKDGVARLVATGDLDASSKFVTALNSALDALIAPTGASVPIDGVIPTAATPTEKNIANAISVSLQ